MMCPTDCGVVWRPLVSGWRRRQIAWNWTQWRQICCGARLAGVSINSTETRWCSVWCHVNSAFINSAWPRRRPGQWNVVQRVHQSARQSVFLPAQMHQELRQGSPSRYCKDHSQQLCDITYWLYCNCLLAGAPQYQLNRLQAVMNSAVGRLICGLSKFDHISQVLHDKLHWLAVPQRIRYKLCWCTRLYMVLHRNIWQTSLSLTLCLWSVAEADCDRPRGVTSSSSQHQ